ncbi:restriction endonuclease subunit S [Flavobacterium microcysteis]|uniref:Restriction endonuclease subunit S n=1 Tax=Flavobacterium microcysteis TaxID=2596891 RepID=A0A501Q140_9FLAO|nr:restriction endonuclease subunit S [Flavobacterium microcysteis]TPD65917.1 restriction endonuclease subunit S [Flavobacterium microcysteis]
MELKFNKDNWEKVTLGDVVFEPKETAKDISEEGLEHIVGLEHIESGDIHLRNSFSANTDTTFTKVFRHGDVLFGRRRAYLKKAAQATFDGICSGDITVLRANKKLDTRLLPFVIHNDKFFDYAIKHSAGGLSPRVKFKDLANYEFLLPPKNQQAELADLLWAMDDVIEKDLSVLNKFEKFRRAKLNKFYNDNFPKLKLKDIANLRRGSFPQPYGNREWYDDINGSPFVQVNDIGFNFKLKEVTNFKISEKAKSQSVYVKQNTIVISIQGSIGRVAITNFDSYVDRTIIIFSSYKKDVDIYFLSRVLKDLFEIKAKSARGAIIKTITKEELNEFEIIFPDIVTQKKIGTVILNFESLYDILKSKLYSSKALQKSLINQLF